MTNFDQIVGHGEEIQRLRTLIASGKLPHALLFHGPSGVGKRTVAKALAQALFCREASGCGQCPPCQRLAGGTHPDLVLVTKEEKRTQLLIDQIRELSQFLALTAMEAPWKVAILDDAAEMNPAAASALLKTLEEPAPQTLLILVTGRPGSLLPTIRSRCQATRFQALSRDEVAVVLKRELPEATDAALAQAAELADGSAARGLLFCEGDLLEMHRKLRRHLEEASTRKISELSAFAGAWSKPDRFATALELLQGWLTETIHASVTQGGGKESDVLEFARWAADLMERAKTFNLNRQLVMESLFIRYSRLKSGGSI